MSQDKLILHPTDTAQWYALINEAEVHCAHHVSEALESYLVFLLQRFSTQPTMAESVLALEFLKSIQEPRAHRKDTLQSLGDKCLLFAGLFPQRAERVRVTLSYFINLGRSAYSLVAGASDPHGAELFTQLSDGFPQLREILHATRTLMTHNAASLQPEAYILTDPLTSTTLTPANAELLTSKSRQKH